MIREIFSVLMLVFTLILTATGPCPALDADEIVRDGFNYCGGKASIGTVEMLIHREEWERSMTIKAWTRGQKDSLFYITDPPKDYGNGTLKKGREMWTKTINIPS